MKGQYTQHSIFLVALVAGGLLSTTLHAQESESVPPPPPVEQTVNTQSAKPEKEGLSIPRKIAGFGVLAFLIGWMIWRNGAKRNPQSEEEVEAPEDEAPAPEEGQE